MNWLCRKAEDSKANHVQKMYQLKNRFFDLGMYSTKFVLIKFTF